MIMILKILSIAVVNYYTSAPGFLKTWAIQKDFIKSKDGPII
jgi:hypothetical protein